MSHLASNVCNNCRWFDAETVLCHAHPTRVKADPTHWCGEFKNAKRATRSANFVKPTLNDLKEYAASIRFDLDCQSFLDFYDSKAWKIGKNPMKDWQAAVRTWRKKEDKATSPKDCVVCGTAWQVGWKFTTVRGKKLYKCDKCRKGTA